MKSQGNKIKARDRRDKKSERKMRMKIGTLLITVFVIIYIPSFINWVYGQNIRTGMLNNGTIEDSINVNAYIVREEELMISPYDGYAIMEFGEGEKFPAKYKLATIYDESSSELLEELSIIDKKILEYSSEKISSNDIFSEDLVKLDKLIKEQVTKIISQANNNNFGKITDIRKEISRLMEKKANISQSMGKTDAYLESLFKEREQLKNMIDAHTKEIYSEKPGIISYCIDNYEIDLNPAGIKQLRADSFNEIEQVEPIDFVNSVEVAMNQPFAKIITGIEYYLVTVLERQQIAGLKEGSGIKIRINEIDKLIDGKIDYISDEMSGKFVVSIKIERFLSDTTAFRKVNIDIIRTYYSGIKVPLDCLMRIDPLKMEADIMLVEANYAKTQRIKIVGRNNEYAIIDNLEGNNDNYIKMFGIYVLNPRNVQEGQVINR